MPRERPPGGIARTAAQALALLLASKTVRAGLGADELAALRGLRLPSSSDTHEEGLATPGELALMRAVAAAAAGRRPAPDTYAMGAALGLWRAVREGEDLVFAATTTTLPARPPAAPAPPAPPPQLAPPPQAYGAEEDGQAAWAGRAAAAARRALVAVHRKTGEDGDIIVDLAAFLAARVAAGEGGRVRGAGGAHARVRRARHAGLPPGRRRARVPVARAADGPVVRVPSHAAGRRRVFCASGAGRPQAVAAAARAAGAVEPRRDGGSALRGPERSARGAQTAVGLWVCGFVAANHARERAASEPGARSVGGAAPRGRGGAGGSRGSAAGASGDCLRRSRTCC